jgi:hypothetical protein
VSSSLDIPVHLALVLMLATGDPLPAEIDRAVLAPRTEPRAAARADLGYTEERWIEAVARHGAKTGLGDLARRVFRTSSGRYYVPVETDRHIVLALMRDPAVAARVAGAAARADALRIAGQAGRPARTSELYAAHVVGIDGALALVKDADTSRSRPAAELMPEVALTEPSLFFRGRRPRSATEIIAEIEAALARALPIVRREPPRAADSRRPPEHTNDRMAASSPDPRATATTAR